MAIKGSLEHRFDDFRGSGVFLSDGEAWRRHRKIANTEFSTSKLRERSNTLFRDDACQLANILKKAMATGEPVKFQIKLSKHIGKEYFVFLLYPSVCLTFTLLFTSNTSLFASVFEFELYTFVTQKYLFIEHNIVLVIIILFYLSSYKIQLCFVVFKPCNPYACKKLF